VEGQTLLDVRKHVNQANLPWNVNMPPDQK
jgi:hypothetical protein